MPTVVALLDDLIFGTRIGEAAKSLGLTLRTSATLGPLLEEIGRENPALAIVDLNARADAIEAIRQLRAATPNLAMIAFVSHVQTETAARAREAGCEQVLPRSRFVRELATILAHAKSEKP